MPVSYIPEAHQNNRPAEERAESARTQLTSLDRGSPASTRSLLPHQPIQKTVQPGHGDPSALRTAAGAGQPPSHRRSRPVLARRAMWGEPATHRPHPPRHQQFLLLREQIPGFGFIQANDLDRGIPVVGLQRILILQTEYGHLSQILVPGVASPLTCLDESTGEFDGRCRRFTAACEACSPDGTHLTRPRARDTQPRLAPSYEERLNIPQC